MGNNVDSSYFALLIPETEAEYRIALQEIELLLLLSPKPGTIEARKLETISSNLQKYESKHYPIFPPDPIDAIKFRMEQQGLKQRDLEPFIGSKSRVSEILNNKRPLTMQMAQSLHDNLGIPASVLLKKPRAHNANFDWSRFPIGEMLKRGWIKGQSSEVKSNPQPFIEEFLKPLGTDFAPAILFRKTKTVRAKRDLDDYSMLVWIARVVQLADEISEPVPYRKGSLKKEDLRHLAKFSTELNGPILAKNFLLERGIKLIIERHLQGTKLDAVLIYQFASPPIIGMTIRQDRIDNFWFSLMHELAHLILHTTDDSIHFVDNFNVRYVEDPRENEADMYARDILIPENKWKKSVAFKIPSPSAVKLLAKQIGIHPAIVAGRIRFELNNYQLLHNMVGQKEVKKQFSEVQWS